MSNQAGETTIIIYDVQHGSSTYIRSPNHKDFLVDLGGGDFSKQDPSFSPVNYIQEKYNVAKLDALIITHPDADHLYDILNLPDSFVGCLSHPHNITELEIETKIQTASEDRLKKIFRRYLDYCNRYTASIMESENPFTPSNNGGIEFEKFFPQPDVLSKKENNSSVVTILSYAGCKVMIPGDNEEPSWRYLLSDSKFLNCIKNVDILVASHHGRKSGYYSELFQHFTPRLVLISDGPEGDTSVTSKYGSHCSGWKVHHWSGNPAENRLCLTTRKDGAIVIKIGFNSDNHPYLDVRIA